MSQLKFKTIGYKDCNDGHLWGPGVQSSYVLQYITCGKGFFETEGKKYSLDCGQCMLIKAGVPVYYYPDKTDPWAYKWVSFYGGDAKKLLKMSGLFERPVTPQLDLSNIFSLFSDDTLNPVAHLKNEGLLHLLLSKIIEFYPATNYKAELNYLDAAKEYIQNNFHHHGFNVNSLADAIGIERSYLFRLFKEGEGVSVIDYIINARLDAAREMLDSGITQVKVVATSCGYENPLYFSNAFKKRFGVSPKHYIK